MLLGYNNGKNGEKITSSDRIRCATQKPKYQHSWVHCNGDSYLTVTHSCFHSECTQCTMQISESTRSGQVVPLHVLVMVQSALPPVMTGTAARPAPALEIHFPTRC